jgi:D-serine deaminase-like pyridoxal phosphate-dependent protein
VEATSSPLRALGIASVALGAVGIGLGVAGIMLRNGNVANFSNANCYVQNDVVMGGGTCQSEYDSGNAMGAMGTAGFVAGGVFAAASVAMIIAAPGARSGERRATLSCGWGPGTVGVGCGGTF